MRLGIIIVNWNSSSQLKECLDSFAFIKSEDFQVVVVDNCSQDHSIALVEVVAYPFPLKILKEKENLGFAKACNLGASFCKDAEYLLFFNPDAKLLNSEAIEEAIQFLKSNANYGICGVQLIDEHGEISRSCARFPKFSSILNSALGLSKMFPYYFHSHHMNDWSHTTSRQVDHVIGALYLIKAELFWELKGFDEQFFVYLEDLDLSYRAHIKGYRVYYLADVQAFHRGGGTSWQIKDKRLFYSLRGLLLYISKHFKFYQSFILFFIILFIEPLMRLGFCLMKFSYRDAMNTIRAYRMLYLDLPGILKSAFRNFFFR